MPARPSRCANDTPMPSEAPAMMAHGPYALESIMFVISVD